MTYKLYNSPGTGSACVQAALTEIGAPFELVAIDYDGGDLQSDWFTKINPRQQLPTLQLPDGSVMTESAAILLHLADAHPEAGLAPKPGTSERAQTNRWLLFAATNLYEGELRRGYSDRYSTDPSHASGIEAAATEYARRHYRMIEDEVGEGPYLFGTDFGVVDIYVWMLMNWFEDPAWMRAEIPKLVAMAESIMARPKLTAVHVAHFGEGLGGSD